MRLPNPKDDAPAGLQEFDVTRLVDAGLLAKRLFRRTEYDAILSFVTGSDPQELASRMRESGRSQLLLTPPHRILPGRDTLELRLSADGVVRGLRRSQSICGQAGIRIFDRESLEAAVPPEATMAFAQALETEQLRSTFNRSFDNKPSPPVEE